MTINNREYLNTDTGRRRWVDGRTMGGILNDSDIVDGCIEEELATLTEAGKHGVTVIEYQTLYQRDKYRIPYSTFWRHGHPVERDGLAMVALPVECFGRNGADPANKMPADKNKTYR